MAKFFVKANIYNELIEKGYGKRDLSKLKAEIITDKNGHRRKVYKKIEDNKTTKTTKKDSYTVEDEKDYYDFIETLNSYDRTDPYEFEKYKNENERLQKNYPKDKVKGYFDYSKKQLSGSKEDIKNYLAQINIKRPSNSNFTIANRTFNKLIGSEYSNTFEKLQSDFTYGDITLDDMSEQIYNRIHNNTPIREE